MFFAKLFIFIDMVFLDMLNEKRFENYLLFPIFATNIFLLWYNLTCFFKSHFSRNLSSQISKAVCYGIFSYASSSRLRKILSKDDSIMKSCSHWGKDMLASIKSVTSRNFLSSLKDYFAMLYLMVYRQKQLCKYLFSQLLQFFHVTIVCHWFTL